MGTSITGIAGTCAYKAPEHFLDKPCDNKIDIYAFAIFTHELIMKIVPYSEKQNIKMNQTLLGRKIYKDGLRPDKYTPFTGIREDIVEIATRNWENDPVDRMTATELVENLQKIYDTL